MPGWHFGNMLVSNTRGGRLEPFYCNEFTEFREIFKKSSNVYSVDTLQLFSTVNFTALFTKPPDCLPSPQSVTANGSHPQSMDIFPFHRNCTSQSPKAMERLGAIRLMALWKVLLRRYSQSHQQSHSQLCLVQFLWNRKNPQSLESISDGGRQI